MISQRNNRQQQLADIDRAVNVLTYTGEKPERPAWCACDSRWFAAIKQGAITRRGQAFVRQAIRELTR